MRSFWKGTIGFGAVAIPVKAYSATEEHSSGLNQLHGADGGRIRMRRFCEVDGAEVPFAEVAKGATLPGGEVVILTDEDLAGLPLPTTHGIDVHSFAPLEQIDPIYFGKNYYLEPEPAGVKPYVLLAEALRESGQVAVVQVALRQRETMGVLRVRDRVIVLGTMLWPDEVREPDFPFLREESDVRLRDLRAATKLITELSEDFAPAQYSDRYQEALDAVIAAKAEGHAVVTPTERSQNAGVSTLLAALQASLEHDPDSTAKAEVGRAAVAKARAAAGKAGAAKETATKAAAKASRAPRKRPAGKR
ncbi:MAG TPA: Ku protein [Pseudonocardiaceae bacterium]|jgi:DNA end-binding protein Ku|nr:Ku protein [Pseudonocardiaceae bacterium]